MLKLSLVFTSDISIRIWTYASAVSTSWSIGLFVLPNACAYVVSENQALRTSLIIMKATIMPYL